ncbi:MAG: hypothetical protein KDE14_12715 [Rhodobacteraceae bacterium]|nr:hypothetical protein [Paracoccaceae bacterium]
MNVFLVILHALISIALIGAITHQGFSAWRRPAPARAFVDRFRAVSAPGYTAAVTVLYVADFALGAYIYPAYVLDVKASLADAGLNMDIFLFQAKEHISVIGLILLPAYWHYWKRAPLNEDVMTRRYVTSLLMLISWWNLVIGHLLNNTRGML